MLRMTFSSVLFTFFGCLHLIYQLNKLYSEKFASESLLFHHQSEEAGHATFPSACHKLHQTEVNNTGALTVLLGVFQKFSTFHSMIRRQSKMKLQSLPVPSFPDVGSAASTSNFSKALVKVAFHDVQLNVVAPAGSNIVLFIDKVPKASWAWSGGNLKLLYFFIIATCALLCTVLLLNILSEYYGLYHDKCRPHTDLPLLLLPPPEVEKCKNEDEEGSDIDTYNNLGYTMNEGVVVKETGEEEFNIEFEPSWEVDSEFYPALLLSMSRSTDYYELLSNGSSSEEEW